MKEQVTIRPSYLEVDLQAVSHNIKQIQQWVGEEVELMPVIKANAYGLGVLPLIPVLKENKIKKVAVAVPEEAIFLRKHGFSDEIVVLNELLEGEAKKVVEYNLTPGISVYEVAKQIDILSKQKKVITKVHVEVDTGMGRVGLRPEDTLSFMKQIKELENIEIEGIYTHFSSADTNEDYTNEQIEKFEKVRKELKENHITVPYIHASASSGILNFPKARYNLVRPGIILYGYLPEESLVGKIDLQPSTKLKSTVAFVKTVPKGTAISYSRTYITDKETKIATIPMGYADGYQRQLSNKAEVVIKGKKAPIIGNICMDNFMVDVSDIPEVKIGDEVILWDNKNITIEELAKKCHTISYEILCTISRRIPRKYIG